MMKKRRTIVDDHFYSYHCRQISWVLLIALSLILSGVMGMEMAYAQCAVSTVVSNTAELNEAVACYNAQAEGIHTITVTQNITLSVETTPITNTNGASLHIVGNGNILSGRASSSPLFTVQSGNVTLDHLTLQNSRGAIKIDTAGVVTLTMSAVLSNTSITTNSVIHNNGILFINDSTISHSIWGFSSSIIHNGGTIWMTNSTFSNNYCFECPPIINNGSFFIRSSTLRGNGRSIRNNGTLSMTHSAIIDHYGELRNAGTFSMSNSTFSNSRTIVGRSLYVITGKIMNDEGHLSVINSTISGNDGGGIYNYGGVATIHNSTISNNSAFDTRSIWGDGFGSIYGSGVVNNGGVLTVTHSTIYSNTAEVGTGLYITNTSGVTSTTFVANSLISGNEGDDCSGDPITVAEGVNLASDDSCGAGVTQSDNLNVAPLANNGCHTLSGASTDSVCVQTHALLAGSDAIDAGIDSAATTDQRDSERMDGSPDVGAYEFGLQMSTPTVTTLSEFWGVTGGDQWVIVPLSLLTLLTIGVWFPTKFQDMF